MLSERDLLGLVERDKKASEKLITLSWENGEWFEVLQLIGKEVAKLERVARAAGESIVRLSPNSERVVLLGDGKELFEALADLGALGG